jgi:hypothetical protein
MKTPDMTKRNLVAVSVKHSEYSFGKKWKFGMRLVLWGEYRTDDNQPRSFAGYTWYLDNAERYSLQDWADSSYHNGSIMKIDEPVKLDINFWKNYKKYDTVLVLEEDLRRYCEMACLSTSRPKEAH